MKKWMAIGGGIAAAVIFSGLIIYKGFTGYTSVNGVTQGLFDSNSKLLEKLENSNQHAFFESADLEKEFTSYDFDLSKINGRSKFTKFIDCLLNKHYAVDYEQTLDREAFEAYLDKYEENATKSVDAYLTPQDDKYVVVPEVNGDYIDKDKLLNDMDNGVVIDMEKYIIDPEVTSEDLQATADEINDRLTWYVEYTNGQVIEPSVDDITINEDNTVNYLDNFIDEQIGDAVDSYNTAGDPISFKCNDGVTRDISGGTWGIRVDNDKEDAALKELYGKNEITTDRTPIFYTEYTDIGGTYIEISLEKQHLWYYQDNVLTNEADVITGLPDGKRNTPTGVYYISEHLNGKYLTGENYRTWVNYWMRLTTYGVGLHDADWQSAFGGELYKTKGSHGCVNLAPGVAGYLYNVSYVGMPVIIY